MQITVVGTRASRALRVLWALEELGLPYEHVASKPRDARTREHVPSGRIPALIADGETLTDSVAIMTFLADAHGRLTHPAGTPARARQDAAANAALEMLDAPLWAYAQNAFALPDSDRVPEAKAAARAAFSRGAAAVAGMLHGPWAAGETFTIADILIAHCSGWSRLAKMDALPDALADHMARARARPAFGRAAAKD